MSIEGKVVFDDEQLDELAALIAGKISTNGAGGGGDEGDDFGGEDAPKELTLSDVQDAVKEMVGKHGKDKVKAAVKKIAGVDKVADIQKDKYQAIIDGLKKIK